MLCARRAELKRRTRLLDGDARVVHVLPTTDAAPSGPAAVRAAASLIMYIIAIVL